MRAAIYPGLFDVPWCGAGSLWLAGTRLTTPAARLNANLPRQRLRTARLGMNLTLAARVSIDGKS